MHFITIAQLLRASLKAWALNGAVAKGMPRRSTRTEK